MKFYQYKIFLRIICFVTFIGLWSACYADSKLDVSEIENTFSDKNVNDFLSKYNRLLKSFSPVLQSDDKKHDYKYDALIGLSKDFNNIANELQEMLIASRGKKDFEFSQCPFTIFYVDSMIVRENITEYANCINSTSCPDESIYFEKLKLAFIDFHEGLNDCFGDS